MAADDRGESGQRLRPGQACGCPDETATSRRAHCAGQFDGGAAGGGVPLRLRGQQGRADQHGEGPVDGVGAGRDLCELRGSGMGGNGHVEGGAGGSADEGEDFSHDPAGAGRHARGDCSADFVFMHSAGWIYYGRGFQREWRGGVGGVTPETGRADGRMRPSLRAWSCS